MVLLFIQHGGRDDKRNHSHKLKTIFRALGAYCEGNISLLLFVVIAIEKFIQL